MRGDAEKLVGHQTRQSQCGEDADGDTNERDGPAYLLFEEDFIDWSRAEPFEVIRGEGECAV